MTTKTQLQTPHAQDVHNTLNHLVLGAHLSVTVNVCSVLVMLSRMAVMVSNKCAMIVQYITDIHSISDKSNSQKSRYFTDIQHMGCNKLGTSYNS